MDTSVKALPALKDNYIYALCFDAQAIIIDPGELSVVERFLEESEKTLEAVLVTHHHADHTAGVVPLKEKYGAPVYGPRYEAIAGVDYRVVDGDQIALGPMQFEVIHTPGHTKGHIVYYEAQSGWLFSGDTLFGAGCGRLFEGSAEDMLGSFFRLGALNPQTLVYPGHEYTKKNLEFAATIEAENSAVKERLSAECRVPFSLREEFRTNPFFRIDDAHVRAALEMEGASSTQVFAELRRRRDHF